MTTRDAESEGHPQDRTVLVTGGAGFIGSHLVDALVRYNDVRVLDDFSTGRPGFVHDDATLYEGDIRNTDLVDEAMAGVDVVFHEAALVDVSRSVSEPIASQSINVDGTLTVLEAARRADARVVVASSAAIYGNPVSLPIDEDHRLAPNSPYGLQKLTVDEYARLYDELYDLPTVPLRYFNVYGPRQTGGDYAGVIAVFLEQARAGEPLTVHGDGTQTRDFVHVSDIVQANLRAAATTETGRAFNVGTGDSVTIRELAEIVRRVTDADVPIEHVDAREGDIDRSRADISRARDRLGYEPTYQLEAGLSDLVSE